MTRQPNLHSSLPEAVELDFEPVKLESTGIGGTVITAVDHWTVSLQNLTMVNGG